MEGEKEENREKIRRGIKYGFPREFLLDFVRVVTPRDLITPKGRQDDWWLDTTIFGPDGSERRTGPLDDDYRRVLVINRPGFTRERYLANDDDLQEFIFQAKYVEPTDVWVDIGLHPDQIPQTLKLCKSDTTVEERDGLISRNFKYAGSRGDLMYFIEPEEPQVFDEEEGKKLLFYPTCNVRIRIVRGGVCSCPFYHKRPKPSRVFDYSQVALMGQFVRPPPEQQPSGEEYVSLMREIVNMFKRVGDAAAAGNDNHVERLYVDYTDDDEEDNKGSSK